MLVTISSDSLSSHLLSESIKIETHKSVTLPLVLYGREIRSVILQEEHTLRVFENRVLMRIFGLMRNENIGYWKKNA
jgi:hypothetical protein